MADEVLKRDDNRVVVLGGITDDANEFITMLRVDPTSKRLKVSATLTGIISGTGTANQLAYFTDTDVIASFSNGTSGHVLTSNGAGSPPSFQAISGANTALSNLASVAINTSLISDTDATDDLGSSSIKWNNIFGVNLGATGTRFTTGWFTDLTVTNAISASITGNSATATALETARTIGGVSFDGTANITVASATGGFTVSGGDLALGTNSITMSGSIGVTGTRVTKLWSTDIESTNIPTVGGTSILTSLTAPQFTTIELGDASDTTLSRVSAGVIAVEGVTIPSISSTNTFTNKRITRRLTTTNGPGATPTTNTDNVDIMNFTGLDTAITSMTTNLSGTPVDGDLIEFRFTDDGTARAITWGASFGATTVALPTTTVISTMLRALFEYNGSIWQCIATA